MNRTAIVVVAYNRAHSLKRILKSLDRAFYMEQDIPLVISIDYGDNEDVLCVARDFEWKFGDKSIICQGENLGLRRHILACGNLTHTYGSIIMLEDDLYVGDDFYSYAVSALQFAEGKSEIGGISLYNHLFNVHVREPFEAISDGYDNWYMQMASSWGQAWTESQWTGFVNWYEQNQDKTLSGADIPKNVTGWSDKSWLKYFICYLIQSKKYFLYPRVSRTTNFFDEGTHNSHAQTDFQVPLEGKMRRPYLFSTPEESEAVYDAFFENIKLAGELGIHAEEMDIDLYGYREQTKPYILTSRALPYEIIQSFARELRPADENIIHHVEGNELFLYDTRKQGTVPQVRMYRKILYHYRGFRMKYIKEVAKARFQEYRQARSKKR